MAAALLLFAALATFSGTLLVVGELLRLRMRWLAFRRRGETADAFERYFVQRGHPARIAKSTYSYLQRIAGVRNFPARPHDSLVDVYGLGQDEVLDMLCVVASMSDCDAVLDERAHDGAEIQTVEDVVRTVARLSVTPAGARRGTTLRFG